MCSLGHHDGPDVSAPKKRRRSDGSMARVIAETPRKALRDAKAAKTAELAAQLKAERDGEPFNPGYDPEQYELLPPGVDQLPDHMITEHKPPYWVDIS